MKQIQAIEQILLRSFCPFSSSLAKNTPPKEGMAQAQFCASDVRQKTQPHALHTTRAASFPPNTNSLSYALLFMHTNTLVCSAKERNIEERCCRWDARPKRRRKARRARQKHAPLGQRMKNNRFLAPSFHSLTPQL